MFAWVPIPRAFAALGSLAFSKLMLERANVAVAPGIGFGEYGEGYVRIALVENRQRLRQAARNIKTFLAEAGAEAEAVEGRAPVARGKRRPALAAAKG